MNQAQKAWEEKRYAQALALLDKLRPVRSGQEDLRGPEWHHMWKVCGGSDFDFRGHTAGVTSMTYSPDGKTLATGDAGGGIRLWDVRRRLEMLSLPGHRGVVSALAFSPDGRRLATAGHDCSIYVWDAATGEKLAHCDGHTDQVLCVAFHSRGDFLVSGSRNGSVHIWNSSNGSSVEKLPASRAAVLSVAFTGDGKSVVVASDTGVAQVWSIRSAEDRTHRWVRNIVSAWGLLLPSAPVLGTTPAILFGPPLPDKSFRFFENENRLTSLALSTDGETILVGRFGPIYGSRPQTVEGTIELHHTPNSKEVVRQWKTGPDPIRYCCFSPDGKRFAVSTLSSQILIYSTIDGELLRQLREPAFVNGLCFRPDGSQLATAGEDQVCRVHVLNESGVLKDGRNNVAFSRDGRKVVASGSHGIWDTVSGDELTPNKLTLNLVGGYSCSRLGISPDGRWISNGKHLLDLNRSQENPLPIPRPVAGPLGVAFRSDGRLLAVAMDNNAALFELEPLRLHAVLSDDRRYSSYPKLKSGYGRWTSCVAFSPDGKILAVGHGNMEYGRVPGEVELWDVESKQLIRVLDRHNFSVWDLAFSPDGKYLAGACGLHMSPSGEVKVWEAMTGREVLTLGGYVASVWSVSFSPDGRSLATGSGTWHLGPVRKGYTGEVRVWDLAAGREVVSWRTLGATYGVAYSSDGRQLAVVGQDGMGRIWGPDAFRDRQ